MRYFGTEYGSEIELTPSSINIVAGSKEPLKICFDDALGVTLTSHKKLTLNAGQEISFITPKRINISAQSQLFMKKSRAASGFSIENEYHFKGNNTGINGEDRESYSKYNDDPQVGTPTPAPAIKEEKNKGFNWGNILKCLVGAVSRAAMASVASAAAFTGLALSGGSMLLAGAAVGATAAIGLSPSKGGEKGNNKSLENYIKESVNRVLVGALLGTIGTHSRGKSTTVLSWIGDKVKNTFNSGVSAIGNVAHNYVSTNDNSIDNCQKFIDEKLNECFDFINSKVDSGFETIESKFGINKEQKVYSALKDTIKEKIGFQEGLVKETEDMVVGIPSMLEKYSPSMQIARLVDKTVDAYEDPEKYINGEKGLYEKASYVASHPKETMDAIGNKIEKYFKEVDKDPYKRGMLEGRATIFAASMFVGGGEAKVASKAGKGEEVLKIASKVEKEAEALKVASKGKNITIETEFETQKAKVYARIAESRKGREVSTYSEFLKKEKAIIGQIEIKARVNASVIESRKGTKISRYQEFIKEEKKIIDNLRKTEGAGNPIGKLLRDKSNVVRTKLSDSITAFENSDEYTNLSNTQRKKIDRKIKSLTKGNVATADVNIPGIKKEFSAHSQIHSMENLGADAMDFSYTPADSERIFKNYVVDEFLRYNDTEAKILEDIASKIKNPNIKGEVNLFTELDTCQSCTNIILEFRAKYPNIKLNIFTNNTVSR